MRFEHEGGTAAWLMGALEAPSVLGHAVPLLQELWTYQSLFFFEPLGEALLNRKTSDSKGSVNGQGG